MLNSPFIIYGLIFVSALLASDAILRLFFSRRRASQDVRNRLESLKLNQGADTAFAQLLTRRGVNDNNQTTLFVWLNRMITQSGLELPMARRFFYVAGFFVFGFLLSFTIIDGQPILQYLFAAVFAVGVSLGAILWFRNKRIKTFQQQLPPSIDIIVRSLSAGHPLNAAIALVAREMPDPIGSEFGILSDQMTFGAALEDGMHNMIERVGAEELNLLSITVSVQRGTGGNLSEILENLSKMIRDRLMIKQKVRAISAEGRITARIMVAFPFILYWMINALVPDYFDPVWETGYGTHFVVACLTIMMIGALILRKLVNFDF